jgi:hypothetical protein
MHNHTASLVDRSHANPHLANVKSSKYSGANIRPMTMSTNSHYVDDSFSGRNSKASKMGISQMHSNLLNSTMRDQRKTPNYLPVDITTTAGSSHLSHSALNQDGNPVLDLRVEVAFENYQMPINITFHRDRTIANLIHSVIGKIPKKYEMEIGELVEKAEFVVEGDIRPNTKMSLSKYKLGSRSNLLLNLPVFYNQSTVDMNHRVLGVDHG